MTRRLVIPVCLLLLGASLPLCASPPVTGRAGDPVPVLCFHGFRDDSVSPRGALTTTYGRLEAMLKFLQRGGYTSSFPEEVQPGPGKSVTLTFDDGTRDQLRAAGLLEEYGFRGIFFVIPRRVMTGSPRSMTAEELRKLAGKGHRIAPHGYSHEMMPESPGEVEASRDSSPVVLARIMGDAFAAKDFAFPFGHYDSTTVSLLEGTYRYLYTVNPGYWDGSSALVPRMIVTTDEDEAFFEGFIAGAPEFRPPLALVTPDGTVSPVVEFRNTDTTRLPAVEMISVSPDLTGRLYTRHALDTNIVIDGNRVVVRLKNQMQRYYAPDRRIISYALVARDHGGLRFLSAGQTHWIEVPLSTSQLPLTH